jgi:superfamily II DNA or RNA helicase
MMSSTNPLGTWVEIAPSGQVGRVVDVETLWGAQIVSVFLPQSSTVVRIRADRAKPADGTPAHPTVHHLRYAAAAARIADALTRDDLIAPLEGTVTPLPHQLYALGRALSGDRVRYLFADEVGLGKTIEAGLVIRELKLRGLARRILVVAPSGLCTQWVEEMRRHFREDFRLVLPGQWAALRQLGGIGPDDNLWHMHDQVVCPVDAVKPMETRRGWSPTQLADYNRQRFEDLVDGGWDLIIVDEAHRLGGSTEQVARYKLGEALSQASPYLLLLSATPHQGKTDGFRRLLTFLDRERFAYLDTITRDAVAPYVVRTEKRAAIDADGNALFRPRRTQLMSVAWGENAEQRALYDAVTAYVRDGYNRAMATRQTAAGFLMILMQRLVTSSTRAIRVAMERRLVALDQPEPQGKLFEDEDPADWAELDGQAQLDALVGGRVGRRLTEQAEVETLLAVARRCEARMPDTKLDALHRLILQMERDENEPELKVLVFTEFVPTQQMVGELLTQRGISVAYLNGAMSMDERRRAQADFAQQARVLVSTDAGGEGLNLQFCHVIVNYDMPWNPMKIEQRIGRVDRIGQKKVVRAYNFALEDSVELRVQEVLEEKLERILHDFGVDKLSDVLDSTEAELDFDDLYAQSLMRPESARDRVDEFVNKLQQVTSDSRQVAALLSPASTMDAADARRIADSAIPDWTQTMVTSWLLSQGQTVNTVAGSNTWTLHWPDGEETACGQFQPTGPTDVEHLGLEHPRVRGVLARLAPVEGCAGVPQVVVPGVSEHVAGVWSLWRVALQAGAWREQRFLPMFIAADGRSLLPTARLCWERLVQTEPLALGFSTRPVRDGDAMGAVEVVRPKALQAAQSAFQELVGRHGAYLGREKIKGEQAFAARRGLVARLGLPQVRQHRLAALDKEESTWRSRMAELESALPEMDLVAIAHVRRTEGAA